MIEKHNFTDKEKLENKILRILDEIQSIYDKDSNEYKNLVKKIAVPIWKWCLLQFKEDDVRIAGLEISNCIIRTINNYTSKSGSYLGYLYTCLRTEILHKRQKGEVSKFRMCTREEYTNAIRLIKNTEKAGKNPCEKRVKEWLVQVSGHSLEEVEDLINKYYQSQVIEEQLQNNDEDDEVKSVFETENVKNNYLTPEEQYFKTESFLLELEVIEKVFNSCQKRQKEYLNSLITYKLLSVMEKQFLLNQIVELLEDKSFIDLNLLQDFVEKKYMPTQKDLAIHIGKDEGYISNSITNFFEKVQSFNNKVSTIE